MSNHDDKNKLNSGKLLTSNVEDNPELSKICNKCYKEKEYNRENFRPKRLHCRDCEREASRARSFKYTRGISYQERDELLKTQGGVCKACSKDHSGSVKGWHVDHCHTTGEIRGVLCANCNIALGQVSDSIPHLLNLITYLESATTIPKGSTP